MKKNYRYEFAKNSTYKYGKQETIEYILSKNYGDTLSYLELGKLLGYNAYDELELHKLKDIMSHLKLILIDYGYILKTVVGIGYYILKPKQVSGYCYHTYIRKTESLLNKSERILNHVDKGELSAIRTQEYTEVVKLNKDVSNSISQTIYKSDYEKNKEYYDNLQD